MVLRLHPAVAPVQVAILPLSRKEPLPEKAKQRAQKRYGVLPTSKAPFTG